MLSIGVSLSSIMTPSPKGRKTIVHYAASKGEVRLLNILSAHGATSALFDIKDKSRNKPSHIARKNQQERFIDRLIALGVNTPPYVAPINLELNDLLNAIPTTTPGAFYAPGFLGGGFGGL
jgi:ankyrin repeat protein